MDDSIANINNVSWIKQYNSKKNTTVKKEYRRKKRKKFNDLCNQDDNISNDEQGNPNDDVGHKIDINI